MDGHSRFIEKWSWDKEIVWLYTIVPTILALAGALFLYPLIEDQSLYFLIAIPFGIFFSMIYGFVGSSVRSLRKKYSSHGGWISESLLQIGNIQSPGIVILEDTTLMLVPIVGKECIVQLSEIQKIRKRLGFAVPASIGPKWSRKLKTKG